MSDDDYTLLLEAVRWIERHAGIDAPRYPQINKLSAVADNIANRRQPDPREPHPSHPSSASILHILKADNITHIYSTIPESDT